MINRTEPMGELAVLKPRLGKFCDLPGDCPRITSSSPTPTLRKWCFGVWFLHLYKIDIKYHPHIVRTRRISHTSVLHTPEWAPPKQNTGSFHPLRTGTSGPFQSIPLPQEALPDWLQSALITLPKPTPFWLESGWQEGQYLGGWSGWHHFID